MMVGEALSFSFKQHAVDRIDLGVSATKSAAINCFEKLGFTQVGIWPEAILLGSGSIDVVWMTMSRDR
jgi:RimJ/RimL family protein N-acetyltransferase